MVDRFEDVVASIGITEPEPEDTFTFTAPEMNVLGGYFSTRGAFVSVLYALDSVEDGFTKAEIEVIRAHTTAEVRERFATELDRIALEIASYVQPLEAVAEALRA